MSDGPFCTHSVDDPRFPGGSRNLVGFLVAEGVPASSAYALPCADVHAMAATLARSNYLARTERRLLLDEFPPPPPKVAPHHRPGFFNVLVTAVIAGVLVALFLICSPVWRFLT